MLSRSGELECLCITGCSLCEKKVQKFLKKFNTELPYDPVILLLEPKENNQKPQISRQIKCSIYIYNEILFSYEKKWKSDTCNNTGKP